MRNDDITLLAAQDDTIRIDLSPRYTRIALIEEPLTPLNSDASRSFAVPSEVAELVGQPLTISRPTQGRCSEVLFLHGSSGDYALKMATGGYRGAELEAEFIALLHHNRSGTVPVAQPSLFLRRDARCYMLSARCCGERLDAVLRASEPAERLEIMAEMGTMLQTVHRSPVPTAQWRDCLNGQFLFAEHHMRQESIDPDEFIMDGQPIRPEVLLGRLRCAVPEEGKVCMLHGDYRPKNLLWSSDRRAITAVLDWAFWDLGDPYYDLAIVLWYAKTDQERQALLCGYGTSEIDESRLRFFEDISRFTNV